MRGDADLIKNEVDMLRCLDRYGLRPNRGGFICCPFHSEDTPSCRVTPDNKHLHCFGCGEHADVISFVMKYFGITFREAVQKIDGDFNLGIDRSKQSYRERKMLSERVRRVEEEKRREREKFEALYLRYENALDVVCAIDVIMREFEPTSEEWAAAARRKEAASYFLDLAEEELYYAKLGSAGSA